VRINGVHIDFRSAVNRREILAYQPPSRRINGN